MKAIVCELCGSNDVVKQGEYFVCQSCGTKYEPEAAKKLLVEIDNSSSLSNLYSLARRARDEGNSENAAKYYSKILEQNPNDWEAYYYSALFTAQNTTVANIGLSATNLSNAIPTSFQLLDETTIDDYEKEIHAAEMFNVTARMIAGMVRVSIKSYREYKSIGADAQTKHEPEYKHSVTACCNVLVSIGDAIERHFLLKGNGFSEDMKDTAIAAWESALSVADGIGALSLSNEIVNRIRRYDSDYQHVSLSLGDVPITDEQYQEIFSLIKNGNKIQAIKRVRALTNWGLKEAKEYTENVLYPAAGITSSTPNSTSNSNGGCYVATAVYGSYDCPEVWTLRRYRDRSLASTKFGRCFIRMYYAVSPTLVNCFGDKHWFRGLGRRWLDRFVSKLQDEGFASTPYDDINW